MVFLSINENTNEPNLTIDENDDDKNNKKTLTKELSDYIHNGAHVFILIYMNDCGPCNQTRPEWKKIENVLRKYKDSKDIIIVNIEQSLLDKVKYNKISPMGFPTIKYISKNGNKIKDYDDVDTKDEKRTVGSFVQWIEGELKKNNNQEGGKKSKTKSKTKKNKKHKWSMKYKKSINCKRPKGFSQKQFCKYNKMANKK